MIEYVIEYSPGTKPEIIKKFVASSGEEFTTNVYIFEESERVNLSDDEIYSHIANLLSYMRDVVKDEVSPILKDEKPSGGWPLTNWEKVETAKEEIFAWWEHVYYREEPSDV